MPKNATKLRRVSIREDYFSGIKPASVDQAAGIIKRVKILGLESDNGRRYTLAALKKAIPLYEGRKVNVNHPAKPHDLRSAYDRLGKLVEVECREDGLYGDLVLLRTHPIATQVLEAAEKMPDAYALSHNVDAKGFTDQGGIFVVEEIIKVRSVDLVADGGTNKSLFEGTMPKVTFKKIIEDSKLSLASKKALLEGGPEDVMSMEMDPENIVPSETGDWKQDLVAAIGKLVSSEDEEAHKMAQKIMAMLKPAGSTQTEGDEEKEEKEEEKTESRKEPRTPGTTTITEAKAKALLKLAGVPEDKALLETLQLLPEDKALPHIEWVKGLQAKVKTNTIPRSSSPMPMTEGKESKPATTPKGFTEAITR